MAAIKKLANAAKVSEDVAKQWLTKQALWQVYLPGPHYIPRPKFDVSIDVSVAIRKKAVASKPATPYMRPVGENERKLPSEAHVRYLYYPGELEGGGRRATDPIWSLKVFKIQKVVTKPETLVVYYLLNGPKRGFVREEMMVVPLGTVLPPPAVR